MTASAVVPEPPKKSRKYPELICEPFLYIKLIKYLIKETGFGNEK
jgi:hypothetical protein